MSRARNRPWPGAAVLELLLENRGWGAQAALARETGIDESTISRFVSQQQAPTPSQLLLMSRALGISVDYLLGVEEKQPAPAPVPPDMVAALRLLEQIRQILGSMLAVGWKAAGSDKPGRGFERTDLASLARRLGDIVVDEVDQKPR